MSVEFIETQDGGRTARCVNCGWHGVPTILNGQPQAQCPTCAPEIPKGAGRNRPCACGSGKKAKKCCSR